MAMLVNGYPAPYLVSAREAQALAAANALTLAQVAAEEWDEAMDPSEYSERVFAVLRGKL